MTSCPFPLSSCHPLSWCRLPSWLHCRLSSRSRLSLRHLSLCRLSLRRLSSSCPPWAFHPSSWDLPLVSWLCHLTSSYPQFSWRRLSSCRLSWRRLSSMHPLRPSCPCLFLLLLLRFRSCPRRCRGLSSRHCRLFLPAAKSFTHW